MSTDSAPFVIAAGAVLALMGLLLATNAPGPTPMVPPVQVEETVAVPPPTPGLLKHSNTF
jgi:hypothetical protein